METIIKVYMRQSDSRWECNCGDADKGYERNIVGQAMNHLLRVHNNQGTVEIIDSDPHEDESWRGPVIQ